MNNKKHIISTKYTLFINNECVDNINIYFVWTFYTNHSLKLYYCMRYVI